MPTPDVATPDAWVVAGLGDDGSAFVMAMFADLADWSHADLQVLRLAGQTLDRLVALRARIDADGIIASGARGRTSAHPLLRIELATTARFESLVKALMPATEG